MKKGFLCCLTLLLSCWAYAQPAMVDKVVAVVGDNIILLSDLEAPIQQAKASGESVNDNMRCQALDQMLLEKFFLAQAQLDSVYVSEDEVDAELDKRIRYFISNSFGSQQKLEEFYGKTVAELKEDFRKDIKNQMLAEKMQGRIFTSIKVTPGDVKDFYDHIPKDSLPYFNAEIELAQIVVFPKVSQELKNYAYEKAKQIRQDIIKGADFAVQAKLYSCDPGSKKDGGDLGFINRGEMVPEFEAAAFRLEEGKISDIVESQYGYHIVQCLERKGEKVHVRHILICLETTSFDKEAARVHLDSIRSMILDPSARLSFNNAVKEFSEDEMSKSNNGLLVNSSSGNSYYEMNQLDAGLLYAMTGLQLGEISKPVSYEAADGKSGYRVIKLVSQSQPHVANLKDDYAKIQAVAKQAKQQEALLKWIKEKKSDTYIFIDDEYRDCDAMQKWLKEVKSN